MFNHLSLSLSNNCRCRKAFLWGIVLISGNFWVSSPTSLHEQRAGMHELRGGIAWSMQLFKRYQAVSHFKVLNSLEFCLHNVLTSLWGIENDAHYLLYWQLLSSHNFRSRITLALSISWNGYLVDKSANPQKASHWLDNHYLNRTFWTHGLHCKFYKNQSLQPCNVLVSKEQGDLSYRLM